METAEIEKTVMDLEKKALDSWSDGDPTRYGDIYAIDATYFDDIAAQNRVDGREAFKEYMANLKGNIPKHTYEVVNPKVQVLGDVAIYSFRYHPFSFEGKPLTAWKATSVYCKRHNEWKIVHGHWSMNKENV